MGRPLADVGRRRLTPAEASRRRPTCRKCKYILSGILGQGPGSQESHICMVRAPKCNYIPSGIPGQGPESQGPESQGLGQSTKRHRMRRACDFCLATLDRLQLNPIELHRLSVLLLPEASTHVEARCCGKSIHRRKIHALLGCEFCETKTRKTQCLNSENLDKIRTKGAKCRCYV